MEFSFWERATWLENVDYTIIGSGIVGLTCGLHLQNLHPDSKILILERGVLPSGASTKNAGFACFGSISEILSDLKTHTKDEVLTLIKQRYEGLSELREIVGDQKLDYQNLGGYELFHTNDSALYQQSIDVIPDINALLYPLFDQDVYRLMEAPFGFKQIKSKVIFNMLEGQIDTGKMMQALLSKVQALPIQILNNINVQSFNDLGDFVEVITDKFSFISKKLLIATNGFSKHLGLDQVKPARAQVLITKPIDNLKVKGTFHLEEGYYYFRNINNRILLGGGRNLDFKGEETLEFGQTSIIQNKLDKLLRDVILPHQSFEIDQRWSGIMGLGTTKKPILKKVSQNVACGVRLGGMGVAIGSTVGKKLANLI